MIENRENQHLPNILLGTLRSAHSPLVAQGIFLYRFSKVQQNFINFTSEADFCLHLLALFEKSRGSAQP